MNTRRTLLTGATASLLLAGMSGCFTPTYVKGEIEPRETGDEPRWGLTVGDRAPDATLLTADGSEVSLAALYQEAPLVVAFYRGGWCPYCNSALTEWQDRHLELKAAGGTMIAITPEKPSKVEDTVDDNNVEFRVFSDANFEAADGFEIRDTLGVGAKAKYAGFGVNVGGWNASDTWELPHPATFVIDRDGIIRFRHVDTDYTVRADPTQVIEVVKNLTFEDRPRSGG